VLVCASVVSTSTLAQSLEESTPQYKGLGTAPELAAQENAARRPNSLIPDASELLVLIRTSLLTLNDAMATDNFTVLRDLISPSVRDQNTAGRLAQIFSPLIAQRLNLAAVAILTPKLTEDPSIDAAGRLHVNGFYPGEKARTNFQITFEVVDRRWRLYGLSVNLGPADKQSQVSLPAKKTAAPGSETKDPAEP
jgi:hypothetical protein